MSSLINIELDVINKSEHSRKILRDINFLVNDKSFKINKNILDNPTRKRLSYSTTTDDLKVFNLQAKEVRTLDLSVHFNKDFKKILSANWFLEYRSQRNIKHKVNIQKNK